MLSAQGASSRLFARLCCVHPGAFGQRHSRMMLPASLSFRISLLVPDAVRPERTTLAPARRCLHIRNQAVATRYREPVTKVRVSFKLPYRCHFGQNVYLVGAGDELGNWNVHESKPMKWSDGDVWMCEVELSSGKHHQLEYKYVVRNSDGGISAWKPGHNCKVLVKDLPDVPEKISVFDAWDGAFHDVQIMLHRPCPHGKHSKSKILSNGPSEGDPLYPSGGQSYPSSQSYRSGQGYSSDSTAYGFDSEARASDGLAYSSDTLSSELFTTATSTTPFSKNSQLSRSTLPSSAGFAIDNTVVRNLEPSNNPFDSATNRFDTTSSSTFTPPNLTSNNVASSSTTTAPFTSDARNSVRDTLNPTPSNLPSINDTIESFYPQTPGFSNQAASSTVSSNAAVTPSSDGSSYPLDPLEEIRSYAEHLASFAQRRPSSPGITDQWPPSTSSSDSSSNSMGASDGVTSASALSYRSRGSRRNRFGPLDVEEGVNDSIVDFSFGSYQPDPTPSAPTSSQSQFNAQTVSSLQTESVSAVSAAKMPGVVDTGSLARESARTESPSTAIVESTSMSSSSLSSEEEVESPTLSQLAMVLSERNAVESAMKRALQEIDSHLEDSMDLGGKLSDPAHETRLEMDRKLAAANMRVNAYAKVLNACPPVKELKAAIELEKRDAQSQS